MLKQISPVGRVLMTLWATISTVSRDWAALLNSPKRAYFQVNVSVRVCFPTYLTGPQRAGSYAGTHTYRWQRLALNVSLHTTGLLHG